MINSIRNFIIFIILFAGIDQITKQIIIYVYNVDTLKLNAQFMSEINSFLNFHLVWNKGFAFGLFQKWINVLRDQVSASLRLVVTHGLIRFSPRLSLSLREWGSPFISFVCTQKGAAIKHLLIDLLTRFFQIE